MITKDSPHTVCYPKDAPPAWEVVYWKDGVASGEVEANVAELRVYSSGIGWTRMIEFSFPDQKSNLETMLMSLAKVHEAGRKYRSKQIMRLLT